MQKLSIPRRLCAKVAYTEAATLPIPRRLCTKVAYTEAPDVRKLPIPRRLCTKVAYTEALYKSAANTTYSGFMFAALITLAHFWATPTNSLSNSAGVPLSAAEAQSRLRRTLVLAQVRKQTSRGRAH